MPRAVASSVVDLSKRFVRRAVLGFFAGVLFNQSAIICLAADYIVLGAWNIEHLGERTPGQRPIALAEHITLAGVDILALEETHDTDDDADTFTNSALDTVVLVLNEGGTSDWEYKLFPKKSPDNTSQLTGIMWNKKRVQAKGEPFRLPMVDPHVRNVHPWDRWATAMKFAFGNKSDVVVIPLHMKANVDGVYFGMKQRGVEAKMLVEQLDAVRTKFSDQDVILIGDTNFKPNEAKAADIITDGGFRDLNDGDTTTYARGTDAPFDRVFVPEDQKEFQFCRQHILASAVPEEHEEYLSDHYMIVTSIKVMDDDD
jgi:endonuclease/exonuclease/phosphatase family metal-dependent hydrolase